MLDLAIIGSGPAAFAAAIYAARAGLKVKIFEKGQIGGALWQIAKIENYPGFIGTGSDLASTMRSQAESLGVAVEYGELKTLFCDPSELTSEKEGANPATAGVSDPCRLTLEIDDTKLSARAVIIATGSEPCPLGFEVKPPVSYCAICDGALYKGKDIIVVGGGNAAVQEALHLSELVHSLHLISHSPLKADTYLIDKISSKPNVTITTGIEPTPELLNDTDAVFVFIGKRPATNFMPKDTLDKGGYIKTTKGHMTKLPGVFAAGDVRSGTIKQAITSAADGAAAALDAIDFLA